MQECRNWERGRAVSFLGIFVSNFRYSVFAVRTSEAKTTCLWILNTVNKGKGQNIKGQMWISKNLLISDFWE
jgi:hypothetical protein